MVLEMVSSLHRGPIGEYGCGGGVAAYLPGTLKWSIFLNGSSLRQAWSEDCFAGDKWTALSLGALLGKLWWAHSIWDFDI